MRTFFAALFEYTYKFNDKVLDSLLEKGVGDIPEKSLLLINHTLNAQEIWNARNGKDYLG